MGSVLLEQGPDTSGAQKSISKGPKGKGPKKDPYTDYTILPGCTCMQIYMAQGTRDAQTEQN